MMVRSKLAPNYEEFLGKSRFHCLFGFFILKSAIDVLSDSSIKKLTGITNASCNLNFHSSLKKKF
jgi:hypothetical protein